VHYAPVAFCRRRLGETPVGPRAIVTAQLVMGRRYVRATRRTTASWPDFSLFRRDWAAGLPELIGVFVVSGEQDFLLHVAVKDTDALYAFVIDRLTERAEVADVNTAVVYEHIRRAVLEPL
jgi:DNA-binding Lrp family transcriptional regulator